MRPSFTFAGLEIHWYSVFIISAIVIGYLVARSPAKRRGISPALLEESILFGIIGGVIGARIYHVIDKWPLYRDDFGQIFAIWNGGLAIYGALLGGALGLALFAYWKRLHLLTLLDIWAPSVLLGQALGRLGNWANQEAFGPPTSGSFKIAIDPENRPPNYANSAYFHPTFFYELVLALIGFAILLAFRKHLEPRPGHVLGLYLIIYGAIRYITEFYRFDTATLFGLRVAHVISLGVIVVGCALFVMPMRHRR
jgi:phosphatidylglycerol:prolipoprotein diacylglycerol transferase